MIQRIGILGAGAWGTALAVSAQRAGRDVTLWVRRSVQAATLFARRENLLHLPGAMLDPAIRITNAIEPVLEADAILVALPAQHLREHLAGLAWSGAPAVLCAKGIEKTSLKTMPEVMAEIAPGLPVAVLSGPTFAPEVAAGKPTAVVIAASDLGLAERLAVALAAPSFRPYASDDPVGVALGGAAKNVLAIGCGIVLGRALGENARAALLTRGLAELARLVDAAGGKRETAMGLSGAGDLILTATSLQSRNTSLGIALGQGRALAEILAERASIAEGVESAPAVVALARRHGVDMPICEAVAAILQGGDIDAELRRLLARPLKREA
ncbi:MAG TPA: NAD(P)H-dependent glycerol-3-phosphate dehydrogenase [Candidatus Udaeobacter sp.]|nr:NAD(P)H-dependent glycerol-3-phosphate dehydrogenase [Candidatus Udaeobacter sp.]